MVHFTQSSLTVPYQARRQSPATAAGLQNSLQISISGLASALVAAMASQALSATGIAVVICLGALWVGYIVSNKELSEHFATPDNSRVVADDKQD